MIPLLWVDLETTGLDPTKDLILEVAMVATDAELNVQGEWQGILHHPQPFLESRLNEVTRQMHSNNGLISECQCHEALAPYAAYNSIKMWILDHNFNGRPMAGSNPSFDRGFLKAQMSEVERLFHYRSFDVNTLHAFFGFNKDKNRVDSHRAMDDIDRDIDAVKRYRRAIPDDLHLTDNLP